jgi:antitoxin component YwqK of YwqJK toxin-antitoxin module
MPEAITWLVKEVTFKNGIREGLTKTYYRTGELYQTFGMKTD